MRFGRSIRALRLRRRWRQLDLALAAKVSRAKVARIELGQYEGMALRDLDRVAQALSARTELRLSWNGEALDRLLDSDHARLVEATAGMVRKHGFEVAIEVTFWVRGERGSVDLLAWHPGTRTVLVMEVKTVVPDHQAMLAALDRKTRLGLEIARERGWMGVAVARLLVVRDTRTARRRVAALASTYDIAFPHRGVAIRRWLANPIGASPSRANPTGAPATAAPAIGATAIRATATAATATPATATGANQTRATALGPARLFGPARSSVPTPSYGPALFSGLLFLSDVQGMSTRHRVSRQKPTDRA